MTGKLHGSLLRTEVLVLVENIFLCFSFFAVLQRQFAAAVIPTLPQTPSKKDVRLYSQWITWPSINPNKTLVVLFIFYCLYSANIFHMDCTEIVNTHINPNLIIPHLSILSTHTNMWDGWVRNECKLFVTTWYISTNKDASLIEDISHPNYTVLQEKHTKRTCSTYLLGKRGDGHQW